MSVVSDSYHGLEAKVNEIVCTAITFLFGGDIEFESALRPSRHADLQSNGVLGLAKRLGRQPRDVATEIVEKINSLKPDFLEPCEVAGPGFININFSTSYLANNLKQYCGVGTKQASSLTYIVDYGSPNIAKSMHVGHLRTSIIGDAIVRMNEALGHNVIRQDHQGDWGTQFGMLIEYLVDSGDPQKTASSAVNDLDSFYKQARAKFEADESFAERSRERVVLLQSGDKETLELWNTLVTTSRKHFHDVYSRLGILLTEDDVRGESFYNHMLDETVEQLIEKGLATEDDGALCVFPDGFVGRDKKPFPMIIRKQDGGYNYAATDLATLRDGVTRLKGQKLIYVTDARQSQHFAMVFAVCKQAGWLPENVEAKHVGYGTVMGEDNKPFKTRSGETVQLVGLLDEAVAKANEALTSRTTDLSDEERGSIARAVGIGAIKWADLKNEHSNNYVFSFDRLLAFSGNTGPYVQYASTRAKSVLRKAECRDSEALNNKIVLTHDAERELALSLTSFSAAIHKAAESYEPHHICSYLFELANRFTSFYEKCPVLNADENTKGSRLALCQLSAQSIDQGLNLLGIESVDRM